jgi:hypothetical protein
MRYVNSRFKSRERGFNVFMIYILLTVSSNFFKAVSISTARVLCEDIFTDVASFNISLELGCM